MKRRTVIAGLGGFAAFALLAPASNFRDLNARIQFPRIPLNTGPTNVRPLRQMQFTCFTGRQALA